MSPEMKQTIDASGGQSFISPLEETPSGALTERVGFIRRQADALTGDAHDLHDELRRREVDERAASLTKKSVAELASDLFEKGFAWRDIARMVGVSVPALQKWRRGERATGENRLKLAEINALVQMLERDGVDDPASWFEIRVNSEAAITPIDLCATGRYDLVLEWGTQHAKSAEQILDSFDAEWRTKYVDSHFEAFEADDGMISIRPRS